jgi:4-amino-4-deoxy-L-arabinose transferase-like glycosyltransferase
MNDRRFWTTLAAILLLAVALRGLFPAADPPWRGTVGVVWHDEGAWTHNARNKALFGAWTQDAWNPVYVAPVFTALEYASFEAFGVGVRQARLVSMTAGAISVLLLALGVRRLGGDAAGLFAGALLASNYVYVMYDRAAIMEGLMTALVVASWHCSARADGRRLWNAAAGVLAALAFFTKAAAAFYIAALVLSAVVDIPDAGRTAEHPIVAAIKRNVWMLLGLVLTFALIAVVFVLPHWADYRFYNWQMSVTRKPSYDVRAIATRVSWFPILHDTFSRMWAALCLGVIGAWSAALGWRRTDAAERLLLLWIVVGTLELLLHDVGNERRFVVLIPALVAFASLVLARRSLVRWDVGGMSRTQVALAAPVLAYSAYVLLAPIVRLAFLSDVYGGALKSTVRASASGALLLTMALIAGWARTVRLLSWRWTGAMAATAVALGTAWNAAQFADWAVHRSYKNYSASVELGHVLAPGTAVQGKLANGLALDNRIRPIFIGHGFGNYADRKARGDVRYILTYTDPEIGYEGDQIVDVLAAYPGWRIIMTFPVAETPSGHDAAALIEKRARD